LNSKAVIGLGFGDEGKGITTDYLCLHSKNPLVIRFSGGQQAGHTVLINGIRHVFSNFGSGTLRGIPSYWSKYCTVDPIGLINELNSLINKNTDPALFIDERCPVTTPYDIYANQKHEEINQHGSCGVGIGATMDREECHYSLLFGDLFYPSVLLAKLDAIKKFYGFKEPVAVDRFLECIDFIIKSKNIKSVFNIPENYDNYIFEGSQGLLLDQKIGFFPHVTRANTGSKNILDLGFHPNLYLITRAYQTRHGNGPMTNENIPNNIFLDPDETNIFNKYQGNFRRSLLDVDLLLYGINKDEYIRKNRNKTLVITCLDHIKDEYRFTHNGRLIYCLNENEFIKKISDILGIENVFMSKTNESLNIHKWVNN
jgi:adenylosuccinate synthase